MGDMFNGCENFNQSLNNWNTSNVTNMESMFYECKNFNQPLNIWNTSNVITMKEMFYECKKFNQSLNNWNTSNVTNMKGMFYKCENFDQSLNNWNTSNVTNMKGMFFGNLSSTNNLLLVFFKYRDIWDLSKLDPISIIKNEMIRDYQIEDSYASYASTYNILRIMSGMGSLH